MTFQQPIIWNGSTHVPITAGDLIDPAYLPSATSEQVPAPKVKILHRGSLFNKGIAAGFSSVESNNIIEIPNVDIPAWLVDPSKKAQLELMRWTTKRKKSVKQKMWVHPVNWVGGNYPSHIEGTRSGKPSDLSFLGGFGAAPDTPTEWSIAGLSKTYAKITLPVAEIFAGWFRLVELRDNNTTAKGLGYRTGRSYIDSVRANSWKRIGNFDNGGVFSFRYSWLNNLGTGRLVSPESIPFVIRTHYSPVANDVTLSTLFETVQKVINPKWDISNGGNRISCYFLRNGV